MPADSAPQTAPLRAAGPVTGPSARWSVAARFVLGAAILLGAGAASADGSAPTYPTCSKKPTAADIQGAKGAHNAAKQFYERGDYDRAIQYWRDAYSFDCTAHGVLINIANAYEKKGDKQAAITTLEVYLARAGADSTLEERVANLRKSLKPAATAPTAAPAASGTAPPPATAQPLASATPESPPPTSGEGKRSIAPWFLVGGGVAAAIAGAVLLPIGSSTAASAEEKCGSGGRQSCANPDAVAEGNTGRTEMIAGGVVLGVGGAAIIGGLVWQFAFNKPQPASAWHVQPVLGPREAGLGLSGSF